MISTLHLFRLGLIITKKCNIECRHCWFECNPLRNLVITIEDGFEYIDQAKALKAKWLSITGGEPFLYEYLLSHFIKYSSQKSMMTELVTNGFWGSSLDEAHRKLKRLKKVGLNVLNISIDDFHQEFIPLENPVNCFKAAKSLGIKTIIFVTIKKTSKFSGRIVKERLGDTNIQILGQKKIKNPSALLIESGFIPVGRGAALPKSEWPRKKSSTGNCPAILKDIGISPTGDVYPCCGALSSFKEACIGNLKEKPLNNILQDAWKNPLLNSIAVNGVKIPDNGYYVDKCHQCVINWKKLGENWTP